MAFIFVARRAHSDVLNDVIVVIEFVQELNILLHDPGPVPVCLNPSEAVPAREA